MAEANRLNVHQKFTSKYKLLKGYIGKAASRSILSFFESELLFHLSKTKDKSVIGKIFSLKVLSIFYKDIQIWFANAKNSAFL